MKQILLSFLFFGFSVISCSQWQNNEKNIYFDSGTVGIGTNDPAEGSILHVLSDVDAGGLPLLVSRTKAEYPIWGIQEWHNANGEVMRVTYSGNLGIGEKEPKEKLEVNGNVLIKENNALMLTSPNGAAFKITVDDNGDLITTRTSSSN